MVHLTEIKGPVNKVIWNKRSLQVVRTFPESVRKDVGYLIYKLQIGESVLMPHSRVMPSVGPGCYELRVNGEDGTYRVFYFIKIKDQILIFHAFQKKTEQTSRRDLSVGKKNLKEMLSEK